MMWKTMNHLMLQLNSLLGKSTHKQPETAVNLDDSGDII